MKPSNNFVEDENHGRLKVQITEINGDIAKCKHTMSSYTVKAFIKRDMHIEVGQIVILEYRKSNKGGGYIIVDELMEEFEVNVLDSQHILSEGSMYTSLIFENPVTLKRMHSLVPSSNRLFSDTNIIIKGDKIKLRMNNGNVFSISTNLA